MKLVTLKNDSDLAQAIEAVKKKHSVYFTNNKISDLQITELVEKLIKKAPASTDTSGATFLTGSSIGEIKKESAVKLGGKLAPINSTPSYKSGNNLSDKGKGGFEPSTKPKNDDWEFDNFEQDEDNEIDYNTANLNKLSKEELQKHKDRMDVLFSKNNKKPGDAGFVYDKQENFQPKKISDWDEDDDF